MDVVRRRLDLTDDAMIIETIATTGEGVRKAFVFGMRYGIQRLDERQHLDPLAEPTPALDKSELRRRLDDLPPLETPEQSAEASAPAPPERPVVEAPAHDPADTTASLLAEGVPPQLAGPASTSATPPPPAAWDAVPPPRREAGRDTASPTEGSSWRRLFSRQR